MAARRTRDADHRDGLWSRVVPPVTGQVPTAFRPHPVVLGGIEMCGEAQPVLDLLEGTEHPAWDRAPDE